MNIVPEWMPFDVPRDQFELILTYIPLLICLGLGFLGVRVIVGWLPAVLLAFGAWQLGNFWQLDSYGGPLGGPCCGLSFFGVLALMLGNFIRRKTVERKKPQPEPPEAYDASR